MDELLTQAPGGVTIRTELDGVVIELPEDVGARPVASVVRRLLAPASPFPLLLTIIVAVAGTVASIVGTGLLSELLSLSHGDADVLMTPMLIGIAAWIGLGFWLPRWIHRRLGVPRPSRRRMLRLGLHDVTLPCSGLGRTILLSDVLFIESGPPPRLVVSGGERLEVAGGLPQETQRWLVRLIAAARQRRGTDGGAAEVPAGLRALQQQTDSA